MPRSFAGVGLASEGAASLGPGGRPVMAKAQTAPVLIMKFLRSWFIGESPSTRRVVPEWEG
jgi:hypothetical protein